MHRAQFLRRYLRAARRAVGASTITVDLHGHPTDFVAWTERYVDELDPLSKDDHDPASAAPESNHYYGAGEKSLRDELCRLSAHDRHRATGL